MTGADCACPLSSAFDLANKAKLPGGWVDSSYFQGTISSSEMSLLLQRIVTEFTMTVGEVDPEGVKGTAGASGAFARGGEENSRIRNCR